jgi:uncharacterized protein YaaQ
MLRQSQNSLFIAVKAEQLDEVLALIRDNCRTQVEMSTRCAADQPSMGSAPVTADLGGAVAFIWDISRIETF